MNEYFYSKLDDAIKKSVEVYPYFMNPAEQHEAEIYLKQKGAEYFLYGGYDSAERKMVFFSETKDYIKSVKVIGSGYYKLTHKDFLGAFLGLGIERYTLGDILVQDNGAIIFVTEPILQFLLSFEKPLENIGRDKVKIIEYDIPEDFAIKKNIMPINSTITSSRLDCVTAALVKISREKIKQLIISGNVQLNYKIATDIDRSVKAGDIISIKKFGRFEITDTDGRTKKDRIKLSAIKFI